MMMSTDSILKANEQLMKANAQFMDANELLQRAVSEFKLAQGTHQDNRGRYDQKLREATAMVEKITKITRIVVVESFIFAGLIIVLMGLVMYKLEYRSAHGETMAAQPSTSEPIATESIKTFRDEISSLKRDDVKISESIASFQEKQDKALELLSERLNRLQKNIRTIEEARKDVGEAKATRWERVY